MPDDLILFLAMTLCIKERNAIAAQHGLRLAALKLDESAAIKFTQTLVNTIDPAGKYWLRNLLGPRLEPGVPESA